MPRAHRREAGLFVIICVASGLVGIKSQHTSKFRAADCPKRETHLFCTVPFFPARRSDATCWRMLCKASGLRAVRRWRRYFTSANRNRSPFRGTRETWIKSGRVAFCSAAPSSLASASMVASGLSATGGRRSRMSSTGTKKPVRSDVQQSSSSDARRQLAWHMASASIRPSGPSGQSGGCETTAKRLQMRQQKLCIATAPAETHAVKRASSRFRTSSRLLVEVMSCRQPKSSCSGTQSMTYAS